LLVIFLSMLALSLARTAWKKGKPKGVRPGQPATAATAES
jgi:hypothetical protein